MYHAFLNKRSKLRLAFSTLAITSISYANDTVTAYPAPQPTTSALTSAEPKATADSLWNEGMEAFIKRKWKIAEASLRALAAEYPSDSRVLDAKLAIGRILHEKRDWDGMIAVLREYLDVAGKRPEVKEARLLLGNAYLKTKKWSEANLLSQEILEHTSIEDFSDRARALLIQAQAQIGLNQIVNGERTLALFEGLSAGRGDLDEENAEFSFLKGFLKSKECARFPSEAELPEDQLLHQFARKSVCLIDEAQLLFRASLMKKQEDLAPAIDGLKKNWDDFKMMVSAPPLKKVAPAKAWETAKKELTKKMSETVTDTEKTLKALFQTTPEITNRIFQTSEQSPQK